MSKRNLWILPMNAKYNIIDIDYTDEHCICENCWRIISKIATVESNWKKFWVWLDCAKTLETFEISNYFEYLDKIKILNRYTSNVAKWEKAIREGAKIIMQESMGLYISKSKRHITEYIATNRTLSKRWSDKFKKHFLEKYHENIIYIP